MASTNWNDPGSINLNHLTLHISPTVLDNAFRFNIVSDGCFGTVYRVPYDGVLCAAKHQCFDDDTYKLKQFQQECLLHSKLHHSNIVRMIGVCYHGNNIDRPIKVMELLELNFSSVVCTVPMYVKLTLIQDISRGLEYLHTCNPQIVHSCLTMEVILLTTNLVAKIAGFTFSIEIIPEIKKLQKQGSHSIGNIMFEASLYCGLPFDIFSIGCLICEIITEQTFYTHRVDDAVGRSFTVHAVTFGRYEYFINMIEDASLSQLVTDCINNDMDLRPSASHISKIIAKKIKGEFCCPFHK